ncbi:MAG: hypothetical protein DMG07_17465 [Acidobacteria bacterium]|nr:MAG: hypothetical protein DMG07_17465 [Acidobacteriota bacterium]
MMTSLLEEVLAVNRSFLGGTPRPLGEGAPFMVLACIDPRLTGLLEAACGLPRGRALVLRTAGNQVNERTSDALRSIASGAYLKEATELFIVGHTDCALARFSSADVIERFRSLGVSRSAFGHDDLRAWFGAFADVKANVIESARALRRAGVLPAAFPIHGLVIDSGSGALEVIAEANVEQPAAPSIASPPRVDQARAESAPRAAEAPPPVPRPAPAKPKPAQTAAPAKPAAPRVSLLEAATILHKFFRDQRHNPKFEHTLADVLALAKYERNPAILYNALASTLREYQEEYPQLAPALVSLKESIEQRGGAGHEFLELVRRVLD